MRNDELGYTLRNEVEQELKKEREDAAVLTRVWQTGEWTEIRTNLN